MSPKPQISGSKKTESYANIDSEISTNKNMQKLGIKCAVHETREADGGADCSDGQGVAGCSGNCGACDIEHISKNS